MRISDWSSDVCSSDLDEARRAEAALRAVAVDHRLLHGMQPAALRQMLDGDELAAIQSAEKLDAGVHGAVAQPNAFRARHNHGAGAAVAFVDASLGPGYAPIPVPERQHCPGRTGERGGEDT